MIYTNGMKHSNSLLPNDFKTVDCLLLYPIATTPLEPHASGLFPPPQQPTPSQYREVMERAGVALAFTRGQSMRPLIWQGHHYVAVVPLEGEPQVGDMLLFEQARPEGTATVLHRLVNREGEHYVTRGDNCLRCELVARAQIIGRATHIYRKGPARWFMAIKKECITIDDPQYQRYLRLLLRLWPLRRCRLWLRAGAGKVYHLIFKRHER